jgi:ferredoxin
VIRVKRDLCLGCGLCLDTCLRDAISVVSGQAEIDQRRCNQCGTCIAYCPQDAIVESAPVSRAELEASVSVLRSRTNDILARIDGLQRQRRGATQDES